VRIKTGTVQTALRRTDIARETAAVGQGSKDVAATTPVLLTEYSACLKAIAAPKLGFECHFGKVFSKLGISSRHELTRRIGQKAVSGATFDNLNERARSDFVGGGRGDSVSGCRGAPGVATWVCRAGLLKSS
jgi:hypothetical protein